jgi:ABC-2 type transport system ATP-binding protein
VEEILKTVGLAPGEKKPVRHYSMGMKQRLGVALALLGGPDLLLLDEPINGLDPEGIREMRELLLRLNRDRGLTILVSSHILGELSKIATRYGIIQEGRMVEQITAAELEQKCADYLHLRTDQPQRAAALLERELRLTRWEMRPEGEIRIYEAVDAKTVGQILTQAGVAVEEMGLHRQDLEDYFLERMGGTDHV